MQCITTVIPKSWNITCNNNKAERNDFQIFIQFIIVQRQDI